MRCLISAQEIWVCWAVEENYQKLGCLFFSFNLSILHHSIVHSITNYYSVKGVPQGLIARLIQGEIPKGNPWTDADGPGIASPIKSLL